MYTREKYKDFLLRTAKAIDISDEMFEKAVNEYQALGNWIDAETPTYKISIYPQGSFALGTVVRPITDSDDYDIDLVCEFAERYNLSARTLKCDVVRPLLVRYKRTSKDIEEKRRCWHIEYKDIPNFHMDIIPAYKDDSIIEITDHDESMDTYEYMGSNPSGYVEWFFDRCAKQRKRLYEDYVKMHNLIVAEADIEEIKRRKIKTPLQRAVQLLKRHRDIKFEGEDSSLKPVSILITTIAGELYNEEDDVLLTLESILNEAQNYIENNKRNGKYFVENPSFPGENFADKWNSHPERAESFITWISEARRDLIGMGLNEMRRIDLALNMRECFGEETTKYVFNQIANEDAYKIKNGTLKVDASVGGLSQTGSVVIPSNHHHGN